MHHIDPLCFTAIIAPKRINITHDLTNWTREGCRLQRIVRSPSTVLETSLMAYDNTRPLIEEVLDETLNGKLEEMIARILKVVGKKPM